MEIALIGRNVYFIKNKLSSRKSGMLPPSVLLPVEENGCDLHVAGTQ